MRLTVLNIHLRLIALVGLLFLTQIISAAMRVTDITGRTVVIHDSSRGIALGSTLTEIVYPLGAQERLVGVDATSTWPLAIRARLPKWVH
jgi:iron complex transport system substrate-binding protein